MSDYPKFQKIPRWHKPVITKLPGNEIDESGWILPDEIVGLA